MNGILIVNKEKNVTSRDVVNDIMHIFNTVLFLLYNKKNQSK